MNERNDIPFVAKLGDALDAAIVDRYRTGERSPGLWRRVAAVGLAGVVIAAAAAVALTFVRPPSAEAVTIEEVDGMLVIRLVDLEANPDQVRAEIAAAGLDIDVIDIPASPSLQGKFVASYGPELAPDVELLDIDGQTFQAFRIPADYEGGLELYLGRVARDGEPYLASGNAFAPGEPLACSGLQGVTVSEAAPVLSSLAVSARWQTPIEDVNGLRMVEVQSREIGDRFVTDAITTAPDEVLIFASPTPESIFAGPLNGTATDCP